MCVEGKTHNTALPADYDYQYNCPRLLLIIYEYYCTDATHRL
jgi:hypothetical protein